MTSPAMSLGGPPGTARRACVDPPAPAELPEPAGWPPLAFSVLTSGVVLES
ncbi:hypothetical protein ACWEOE_26940 [Amycolatopsis sp. NPDC004368]